MTEEDRIEFLETIHALQNTAEKAVAAIDFKVENATDTVVECRVDTLEMIGKLIHFQAGIIKHYVENNEQIIDTLQDLLVKHPIKK